MCGVTLHFEPWMGMNTNTEHTVSSLLWTIVHCSVIHYATTSIKHFTSDSIAVYLCSHLLKPSHERRGEGLGYFVIWWFELAYANHVFPTLLRTRDFRKTWAVSSLFLCPGLWVMAAKFEFEDLKDVSSARVLLQQGLRANPTSKHLWIEVGCEKGGWEGDGRVGGREGVEGGRWEGGREWKEGDGRVGGRVEWSGVGVGKEDEKGRNGRWNRVGRV